MTSDLSANIIDVSLTVPELRVPISKGNRAACAAYDEDATTLAAEAGLHLLAKGDVIPAALLVVTTSSPLAEGGIGQILSAMLDLPPTTIVSESNASVSNTGSAIVFAMTLIRSGVEPVLLLMADRRQDAKGPLGDAGGALLLGRKGSLGELTHVGSSVVPVQDVWRVNGEKKITKVEASLSRAMQAADKQLKDWEQAGAVVCSPTDPTHPRGGMLGSANVIAVLASGHFDRDAQGLVVLTASGISNAFRFDPGSQWPEAATAVLSCLEAGVDGEVPNQIAASEYRPYSSEARAWREAAQDLALAGVRDPSTNQLLYPAPPRQFRPEAKSESLSRRGVVLTRTLDHVFPLGSPIGMAVVDLDQGGRFYGQVVPDKQVSIGDVVALVPRRLSPETTPLQYFWKISPIQELDEVNASETRA